MAAESKSLAKKQAATVKVEANLKRLSDLLEEVVDIFKEDRELATKNYDQLKLQYDAIIKIMECSPDAKLESEMNKALKLKFESSNKLEGVILTISKLLIAQLNNESRERIATQMSSDGKKLSSPQDIERMLRD